MAIASCLIRETIGFLSSIKEIEKDVLFVLSRAWDTYSIYKEYFYYQFNIV